MTFSSDVTALAQAIGARLKRETATTKAQSGLTGGGTVTVDSSGNLKWSERFIVISGGTGSYFATAGYFDITLPPVGTTIPAVGVASKQVTSAGINLGPWEALYYILPIGSNQASIDTNFRIVQYNGAGTVPDNWVLLALLNGDPAGGMRLGVGRTVPLGSVTTATNPTPQYALSGHTHTGYEPAYAAGTTAQYLRGDKTWQALNAAAVGLGNVPNVDATNASNLGAGTVPDGRLPERLNGGGVVANANTAVTPGSYVLFDTSTNTPVAGGYFNLLVWPFNSGTYTAQLASEVNTKTLYYRQQTNGTWGPWVEVLNLSTGDARYSLAGHNHDGRYYTETESDGRFSLLGHTHAAADITSGVLNVARLGSGTANASAYLRGDSTWQPLNAATVGLGNVDNTSDANKPISTATQSALNGKEASITAGTTGQYWRGDKSWQTLNPAAVGLGNVPNVNATNADNISTGTLPAGRLANALALISPLVPAADKIAYYTGTAGAALADITSFGRSLLAAASASAARATLDVYSKAESSALVVPVALMGSAKVTAASTTVPGNTTIGGSAGRISGMQVTVTGEGRPVVIEATIPSYTHSAATSHLFIAQGTTCLQLWLFKSPGTAVPGANASFSALTDVLTSGVQYTFYLGGRQTSAVAGAIQADPTYPLELRVLRA